MGKRDWSKASSTERMRRNGSEEAAEPLTATGYMGLIRRMERERPIDRFFTDTTPPVRNRLKTLADRRLAVARLRQLRK